MAKSHALFIFLLYFTSTLACEREITEDVCPQREGYDEDCERKCHMKYPMRIASGCFLRSTGTLLSLFGIRSFQCKCQLPNQFCTARAGNDPVRLSFSLDSVASHSAIEKLVEQRRCTHSSEYLSCEDQFSSAFCSWQRSAGADWFQATSAGKMPFAAGEQPNRGYLVAVGREGIPVISYSTCAELCSLDSVNIKARIWRAPWISAELCFSENTNSFCAPITSYNGQWMNETIPQTGSFQVQLKFNNVSDGDVIMIDDVSAKFAPCLRTKIDASVEMEHEQGIQSNVVDRDIQTTTQSARAKAVFGGPSRMLSSNIRKIVSGEGTAEDRRVNAHTLRRRLCREGECTTLVHQSSHNVREESRECVGRAGLLQCRQKCRRHQEDDVSGRCVRQHEYPFDKRCICHIRRSPIKRIVGGDVAKNEHQSTKKPDPVRDGEVHRTTTVSPVIRHQSTTLITNQAMHFGERTTTLSHEVSNNVLDDRWKSQSENILHAVCGMDRDNRDCDAHCKTKDANSSGVCTTNSMLPVCECSTCLSIMCDFEKETECGWTDLRLLSNQFNNISIAAKRDRVNRYGLSRLSPESYSGLMRRGWIDGPIQLTVDVYPSETIDVKICVDSLYKCQTQSVAPKSWNRVAAKIKVRRTDKIFFLFHNTSPTTTKTVAMDNISLKSGACLSDKST